MHRRIAMMKQFKMKTILPGNRYQPSPTSDFNNVKTNPMFDPMSNGMKGDV